MNWFENILKKLADSIAETIRKFTAYSLILFFLGAIYGYYADTLAAFVGIDKLFFLLAPLVLAGLAYLVTEIAVILFILLLGLVLLVFL